ncbi:hypothetical protein MASR2M78_33460 [Treponema sp.]
MRAIFFLTAMSCFVYLGLGTHALIRQGAAERLRRRSLEIIFALLCFLLALGTFGATFFVSAHTAGEASFWYLGFSFTWYLSPSVFLIFVLLLSGFPFKPALIFLSLPGLLLSLVEFIDPSSVLQSVVSVPLGWHASYDLRSPWHWLNVANYTLCTLASIFILVRVLLLSSDSLLKRRAAVVLLSILPTFGLTFISGFLVRFFGVETLPPMLPIFLSILMVGLSLSLFRYKLLELTPSVVAERILASVYDAVVLADSEGRVIETNLSGPHKHGRAAEALRGTDLNTLVPEAGLGTAWLAEKSLKSDECFEASFAFETARISPACMSVRRVLASDGSLSGYILSAHDLSAEKDLAREVSRRIEASSALRSVEARFSRAFRASPAGMLIVEARTGIFLDANIAAAQILGVPIEDIVGCAYDSMHLEVLNNQLEPFKKNLQSGEPYGPEECTLRRSDGSCVQCLTAAAPLEFEGKKSALFTIVDITEFDSLRNDRMRAQKLESIGVLAGGIAHDFNNILTAILGNISLAHASVGETGEISEALARAETACLRARDLSRQLLTFSKGGDPAPEPVDNLSLVREAVRMATAGSNVVASFSSEANLPPVFADAGQALQAFNNIALNAVQAMERGGTLIIRSHLFKNDGRPYLDTRSIPDYLPLGDFVATEFIDMGKGIDAELLPKIFDPYVTTKSRGSGLGLAISYSILSRHGGGIAVESSVGKGSRFTVYLPVSKGMPVENQAKSLRFGKGRVLLMDDELAIRSAVEHMLKRLGYESSLASDGEAAFAAFMEARAKGRSYSAIILDLTVPAGLSGVETVARIREYDTEVPIFVSSGYSDSSVVANYASYGFNGVLNKPYSMEELGRRLKAE